MTTKHTKGPWTYTANSWQYTTIYSPDGKAICTLDLEDWEVTEENQSELEKKQEEVAALIAAAPELLNCLLHLQDRDWYRDGVTGDVTCILDADKVRAAIQKATSIGEQ